MKNITKDSLKANLAQQVDDMFAAESWDAFNSLLFDISDRITSLEYQWMSYASVQYGMNEYTKFIQDYLRIKYINKQKLRIKKFAKEVKNTFCRYVNVSTLPGHC